MKKVIITTRAVYHRVATIEVNVPSTVEDENVQQWLWDNEHLFICELDNDLGNANLDDLVDTETRYDVYNEAGDVKYGGHC